MTITGTAEPNRVIVRGTLRLTPAQENELVRQFMERLQTTRKEMGYMGPKHVYDGLLGKWDRYTREFEGDFRHRAVEDELFEFYNSSDNIPQRAIRVFKAKANAKLLNTDPWFSVGQARKGTEDPRIKLVDEYFHELVDEADGKTKLQAGIEGSCVRGQSIMKIARRLDQVHARKDVRLLLVGGMLLRDTAGRFVTEDDEWEDDPEVPESRRLKRDPRLKLAGDPAMTDPVNLPVTETTRRGLSIECKPWKDFYCSPTARTLHDADCFDVYDLDVDDLLARMYSSGGALSDEAESWLARIRQEDGRAKSDSGAPQDNRAEIEEDKDARPKTQVCEGWIKFDADGDNRAEELHVVMDITNEVPIYYDYMAEASPTGVKPYSVLRALPLEDRWHGVGFYQLLENQATFVDRQRNRIDARSGFSGHIKMQRAGAIRDTKFGVPLRFNDPRFYTVEPEFEMKDALGVFSLPPISEEVWKLLESERQNAQLLSGTMTPQDQDYANSPGADTLGGLQIMAKESEVLNDDALQGLIYGVRDTLKQCAVVVLTPENFDRGKCVDVLGEIDAQQVEGWVNEGHARNLGKRIKLLLTKTRNLQQLQSNKQAIETLAQWDAYTPEQQMRYFDIYVDILNSLEVQSPDKVLGDPQGRLAAEQQAVADAAAAQTQTMTPYAPAATSQQPATATGNPAPVPGVAQAA